MRRLRAFFALVESELKQPWLWVFLILIVLIGPTFVVLQSETDLPEREQRPLLSDSAMLDHFDKRVRKTTTYISDSPIMLFRDPVSQPAPGFPTSGVFAVSWQLLPMSNLSSYTKWSFPWKGSLVDANRDLLPILMIVIGILSFPARRRLNVLRIAAPCGRWGCFAMIVGFVCVQAVLVVLFSCVFTGLALMFTQAYATGMTGFITIYFSMTLLYGLGFALLGLLIAEVVQNRSVSLLIGLVVVIGVWEFASPMPVRFFRFAIQSVTGLSISAPLQHPAVRYLHALLQPSEMQFESARLMLQQLASDSDVWIVTRADLHRGLILPGAGLAGFAGFWVALGWLAFPRIVRPRP